MPPWSPSKEERTEESDDQGEIASSPSSYKVHSDGLKMVIRNKPVKRDYSDISDSAQEEEEEEDIDTKRVKSIDTATEVRHIDENERKGVYDFVDQREERKETVKYESATVAEPNETDAAVAGLLSSSAREEDENDEITRVRYMYDSGQDYNPSSQESVCSAGFSAANSSHPFRSSEDEEQDAAVQSILGASSSDDYTTHFQSADEITSMFSGENPNDLNMSQDDLNAAIDSIL